MATPLKLHILNNRAQPFPPTLRRSSDFLWEIGDAERHVDILLDGEEVEVGVVRGFVVRVDGGAGAGGRVLVDRDPL